MRQSVRSDNSLYLSPVCEEPDRYGDPSQPANLVPDPVLPAQVFGADVPESDRSDRTTTVFVVISVRANIVRIGPGQLVLTVAPL